MSMASQHDGEQDPLIPRDNDQKETVSLRDLTKARNMFFLWTFVAYIGWGISVELYTNLFYYVIDPGDYAYASLMVQHLKFYESCSSH